MYGCVAVSVIFLIYALVFSSYWALLAMSIAIVLSCIPWTILRISIDSKDSKPLASLDEYEAQILDQWRRRAFKLSTSYYLSAGLPRSSREIGSSEEELLELLQPNTY